jgi:hypothetical protein
MSIDEALAIIEAGADYALTEMRGTLRRALSNKASCWMNTVGGMTGADRSLNA